MKTIIFDFGGIFNIDDDIKDFWYKNAKKFNIDPDEANQITLKIWLDIRIGKGNSELFWSEAAKVVNMSAVEFKKYFLDYVGFRDDLYNFVKNELKNKYKLGMITNQMKSWFEYYLSFRDFEKIFDVIITSYEEGIAKPDPRIYKIALDKLKAQANDCIYIDDRPKNLEPAHELGMKTILFENSDNFKKDLFKLL